MFSTILWAWRGGILIDSLLGMKKPARPTTPEEEGIEFHPDAWERFERTVQQA
jgi:hypothetical protein